jgi:phosphoglycolate phosphatase
MPLCYRRYKVKYNYCIWDFNGTILDDVELGIYSINELFKAHNMDKRLAYDEYRANFDFPIKDYYERVGFDFKKTPYEVLAPEWVNIYFSNFDKANIYSDVVPALEFFAQSGMHQCVLSASEIKSLKRQIADFGIDRYFEEIMGIDNIYAASKLMLATKWREMHPDERVVFIGDTTHDIETAKALSADCFIVCAGHQCREKFEGKGVTVFDSLTELCEYLKNENLV